MIYRSARIVEFLIAASVLAVILFAVTPDVWLYGEVLSTGDVPDQFLPWREFVVQELAAGRIPLWNRFSFCGAPFLANMQSCVLYPVDRLIDLALKPAYALTVGLFLHLLMGGVFLYGLARTWGARPGPSLLAAGGYALGGFNAIHLLGGNLLTITSSSYLAGHFWVAACLANRFGRGERAGWVPIAGVVLIVLQILSGHAQMTFYGALFVGLYVFGLLAPLSKGQTRLTSTLVLMGALGAMIAAPQILSTLEYSRYSSRTGSLPFDAATEFSFGWEFLLSLFLPEYLGTRADMFTSLERDTYWGDWKNWSAVYVGVAPCIGFIAWTLNSLRSRKRLLAALPLLLPLAAGLFLALGRNNPLYEWVHALPGFGQFRAPSKFLPGFLVPFCVLAAIGLTQLGSILARPKQRKRISSGTAAGLMAGSAVGLLLALTLLAPAQTPLQLFVRDLVRSLSWTALLFSGYRLLIASPEWRKPSASRWVLLAGLVVALDLGPYFSKYLITDSTERLRVFPVEFLKRHVAEGERVHATPEIPQLNYAVPAGIQVTGGYDPFQIGAYVGTMRAAGAFAEGQIPDAWTPPPDWAAELGAKYLLTTMPIQHPEFKPLAREHPWSLYEVVKAKPLVEFRAADGAVTATMDAKWVEDELHIKGNIPSAGSIVIRQVYFPDWVVETSGGDLRYLVQERPFWQKFPVEQGPLDVVVRYDPYHWEWGFRYVTGGSLVLVIFALGTFWSRLRSKHLPSLHAF